jgi:hypothetical protein
VALSYHFIMCTLSRLPMLEPVCLTAPLGGSGERSNLQSNICSTFLFFMLKILFGIPTQFGVSAEW